MTRYIFTFIYTDDTGDFYDEAIRVEGKDKLDAYETAIKIFRRNIWGPAVFPIYLVEIKEGEL